MLSDIRAFFAARGVLEVETPTLSAAATPDPALDSFSTVYTGPGAGHGTTLYLHTSPEFPMKRLLAAGSGSIYQLCKVFRNGESGRLHNPEFTLLEWYRVGFDYHQLMDEVAALVGALLAPRLALGPAERLSYRDAFQCHAGLDPHVATHADFVDAARAHDIKPPASMRDPHDLGAWRDLLLTHVVEPHLGRGRLTFLYDFPASQASLARIHPGEPPLAARFELYVNGVELANGFHELGDSAEQRTRFERQLHLREAGGLHKVPLDEQLLAALEAGLPDCAGVALGVDRLVALAAGTRSIEEVLAFPLARA
jgi:lysyl-tRNA synthetase class 2